MTSPLDEQYLSWLYARIGSIRETRKNRSFWLLLRYLYCREFFWYVPNDDNRVEDGKDLRLEFLDDLGLTRDSVDPMWMNMPCSVLEMIFGVAKLMSFETDTTIRLCMWELFNNLGLSGYNDKEYDEEVISEVVDRLVWRTYEPDGSGGMFPLRHPENDQTDVEIWYQLCNYILEHS